MRVPREKLILWSVCALYEVADRATDDPMRPDFGTKVALAVLHALGCPRRHTDDYWAEMKRPQVGVQRDYIRGTQLRKHITAMKRALKVGGPLFDHEVGEALYGPTKNEWSQHKRLIDHLRQERQREAAKRRADKDCGWL